MFQKCVSLEKHHIDAFLVFLNYFDEMSKIKKEIEKKIILMHFQAKSIFEKHPAP